MRLEIYKETMKGRRGYEVKVLQMNFSKRERGDPVATERVSVLAPTSVFACNMYICLLFLFMYAINLSPYSSWSKLWFVRYMLQWST